MYMSQGKWESRAIPDPPRAIPDPPKSGQMGIPISPRGDRNRKCFNSFSHEIITN